MKSRCLFVSVCLIYAAHQNLAGQQRPWPVGPIGGKEIGKVERTEPLPKPKPGEKPTTSAERVAADVQLRAGTLITVEGCVTSPITDGIYKLVVTQTGLKTPATMDGTIVLTGRDDLFKYVNQYVRVSGSTLLKQTPEKGKTPQPPTALQRSVPQLHLKVDSLEVVSAICRTAGK